ncbi:unnamed protein product [Moneuplotes crassus]|uniref:Uncharacterized protein n=1 Tax=Euplotes crassus TaxID=5936 RepID=A0AAD1XX43_EUPCR|nr:unnamed protein product [Moneuplotes crassus]
MNSISDFLVKEPSAGFYVGIPMLGLLWVLLAYGFMMADRILEREGYKREEVFRQETRQPTKRRTHHKRLDEGY